MRRLHGRWGYDGYGLSAAFGDNRNRRYSRDGFDGTVVYIYGTWSDCSLKAIGFSNRSIFWWHVIRFMLVAGFAEILAVVLTRPITKLWCDPIWAMMGATNVDYYFSPVRIILIYPGIVLAITWIAVSVTAFHIRRIRGTDIVNVE